MSSIKAVLFDFGGTLFDYQTVAVAEFESLMGTFHMAGIEAEEKQLLQAYGETMREVFSGYLPKPFYMHRDLFQDGLRGVIEKFNMEFRPEYFIHYTKLQRKHQARDICLREGTIQTLVELKKRNLFLGVVSNIDEDQLAHLIDITKIEPYFEFFLSSEKAKSCKPDSIIFNKAMKLAKCRPEETLFVGDSLKQDIAGANRAGLNSVLIWHRDDKNPPEKDPLPKHVIRQIPELLDLT